MSLSPSQSIRCQFIPFHPILYSFIPFNYHLFIPYHTLINLSVAADHGLLNDERDIRAMFNAMKTARKLLTGQSLSISSEQPVPAPASSDAVPALAQECTIPAVTTLKGSNGDQDFSGALKVNSRPMWCHEVLPGSLFGNTEIESNFRTYCRLFVGTYFHACGSCAMDVNKSRKSQVEEGVNPSLLQGCDDRENDEENVDRDEDMCVVDSHFRVKGIINLRVVDASVFPRIPSGPTSATCMAMGVAAARLIVGRDRVE